MNKRNKTKGIAQRLKQDKQRHENEKLQAVAESMGYTDVNLFLEDNMFSSTCEGICMNCEYTTIVEPDQDRGYCEIKYVQIVALKRCHDVSGLMLIMNIFTLLIREQLSNGVSENVKTKPIL